MLLPFIFCQIGFGRFVGQNIPVTVISIALFCCNCFLSFFPIRLVGFQHHKGTLPAAIIAVKGFFFFFSIVDLVGQQLIFIIYV